MGGVQAILEMSSSHISYCPNTIGFFFNGPNFFSNHTFLGLNFAHTSFQGKQVPQTFLFCFLLTIFTINLALKKTHHSLNHAMP